MVIKDYKFSLITPTINRAKEIEIFLQSLENQTYRNFELIIIDQNIDISIDQIIEKYKREYIIKHIKSKKKELA
jgi:Glycosyl transferase family 2.